MTFADPTTPTLGYIHERRHDAPDVWTLDISLPDTTFFDFAPGQFNMLTAFGVGEAAISLSGDPADGRLIHTIRDVGPVSRSLTRLAQGDARGSRSADRQRWCDDPRVQPCA